MGLCQITLKLLLDRRLSDAQDFEGSPHTALAESEGACEGPCLSQREEVRGDLKSELGSLYKIIKALCTVDFYWKKTKTNMLLCHC